MTSRADELRTEILNLVEEYYTEAFAPKEFIPGQNSTPVSGKVFDAEELRYLVDSSLDFWLTTGRFAAEFEKEFARFFGLNHAMLVNSGSSADLLAISCLTSPKLGDKRLKPGDEVITVAAGFPTTVNPIIQNQLVPVFIDATIPTYNADVTQLEEAYSEKTRAVIFAHMLGNPFDIGPVADFAKRHDLWFIEDCCDAVGATYQGKPAGSYGHLCTTSFYPAHHITMGEGGCVLTNQSMLKTLVESFRDWGRDCWCDPGKDNTCNRRFDWKLGDLPYGYDHKYTYSHIGYNLKATDMQAAVGLAQMKKLPGFIEARKRNFKTLTDGLRAVEEFLILPEATPGSEPSWFGYPITVRTEAPFTRDDLVRHLDDHKIGTRLLFGGNLVCQPAYKGLDYRVIGDLPGSNAIMERAFWIGVFPGLTEGMLAYMITTISEFCRRA